MPQVRAYDPEGMANARALLDRRDLLPDAYDCADGADAVAIVTEWDLFRASTGTGSSAASTAAC